MDTIGKRIAACIEQSGLTKSSVAEKLKISQPYVSRICSGEKIPSDRTILDICKLFGVSETWLRTGEGEMHEALNQNQQLVEFMTDLMTDTDNSVRKRFITMLSELEPSDWAVLEKLVDQIANKKTDP